MWWKLGMPPRGWGHVKCHCSDSTTSLLPCIQKRHHRAGMTLWFQWCDFQICFKSDILQLELWEYSWHFLSGRLGNPIKAEISHNDIYLGEDASKKELYHGLIIYKTAQRGWWRKWVVFPVTDVLQEDIRAAHNMLFFSLCWHSQSFVRRTHEGL